MKKRVLSAVVMAVIFVPLLVLGGKAFAVFMSILALSSLYELLKIKEEKGKLPIVMKILSYMTVLFLSLSNMSEIEFHYTIDYRVISVLIFAFLLPLVLIHNHEKYNISDALFLIGCTLFLGYSFNLIIIIRNYDIMYIIYLLLISIITDTFALITGRLIGERKLAPTISPLKTIEGTVGGTIMGVFVATCFYHVFLHPSFSLVILLLITTGLSLIGQMGDLVFSMIKRYYNKKDFSNLIPGHGGVLDRFDSLIFIALASILVIGII